MLALIRRPQFFSDAWHSLYKLQNSKLLPSDGPQTFTATVINATITYTTRNYNLIY